MNSALIRFYEELTDFLPASKRKISYPLYFRDHPNVKHLLEAEGVPHAEVDLILVNGKPVSFDEKILNGDRISVYPVFESFDISPVQVLRLRPLRESRFVLDVHLGRLARYLRMMGFDSLYENNYSDDDLVRISNFEKRAILTRDIRLLMRKEVLRGYWLRSQRINDQVSEVICRFDLRNAIHSFSRCTVCNGIIHPVGEETVKLKFPGYLFSPGTAFFICTNCDHIYWKGSHCMRFETLLRKLVISQPGPSV